MNPSIGLHSPPGQLIPVDSRQQHVRQMGTGEPAVVMEAAVGDFSLTWSLVQPEVARFTTAVSYDRAGLGWSDPAESPRDGDTLVRELHQLLDAARIERPVVLVGQSFAGLLVRLYAARYPADVAGMVLVDGAHEDQFQRFPPEIGALFPTIRSAQIEQLKHMSQTIDAGSTEGLVPLVMVPPGFPSDVAAMYAAQSLARPSGPITMAAELDALDATQEQLRRAQAAAGQVPLQDKPLVVLSHGLPQPIPGMPDETNQAYEAAATAMQEEQAALSRNGRRVVAENAGHMIHHDRPDLVVEAIRSVVEAVRAR